jgi:hypothetical protein
MLRVHLVSVPLVCFIPSMVFAQPNGADGQKTPETYQATDAYKAVARYLSSPKNPARIQTFREIADNPSQEDFTYNKETKGDKTYYRLTWKVRLKKGTSLTELNQHYLSGLLRNILEQFESLLTTESGGRIIIEVVAAASPLPPPPPPPPHQSTNVYVFFYAYSYCRYEWVCVGYTVVPVANSMSEATTKRSPADTSASFKTTSSKPQSVATAVLNDELIDDYPKDAVTCYSRSYAAYRQRDYGIARALVNHAVKLNSEDAR